MKITETKSHLREFAQKFLDVKKNVIELEELLFSLA